MRFSRSLPAVGPFSLGEAEARFPVSVPEIGIYRDGAGRLVQLQQIRPIGGAFVRGYYQASGFRIPARPVRPKCIAERES